MLQQLGACLNIETLQCYFPHPADKNKKIYILLDVCHMLKLLRNTLGSYGILIDSDGNEICWKYIVELQKLQDNTTWEQIEACPYQMGATEDES